MFKEIAQTEVTTAFTDLLMAFVIIPMIVAVCKVKTDKTKQKKWWIIFFSMLEAACILGFVAHFICTGEVANMIIWIPLYPLIYEVVNCFFLTALSIASEEKRPSKKDIILVHSISFAAYLITRIIVHYAPIHDIIPLTAFNTIVGLAGFLLLIIHAIKKDKRELSISFCLIPLLPGAFFQMSRDRMVHFIFDFNEDSITHFFLIASIVILFIEVLKSLKKSENQ